MRLEVGQPITFKDDKLIFLNGTVKLIADSLASKKNCVYVPNKKRIKCAVKELILLNKTNGISMLVEPLIFENECSDAVMLNPYTKKAYPYFVRLINACQSNAEDEIKFCVGKLLGLGIGLTPSADDVMMGMLYTFRKLPNQPAFKAFKDSILGLCENCTNMISGAYLKSIIQGAYFELMEQVWSGLCGIGQLDISKLTKIGSNSGAEMLLGMLIALKICGYGI